MTTIHYVIGDASCHDTPARRIIAHVVNDAGRWGAGFTAALSARYPGLGPRYRAAGLSLGQVEGVKLDTWFWVVHLCAQHGLRSRENPHPLQLTALRDCLDFLAVAARACEAAIQMPRLGCGLGGATWGEVEPLLHERLAGCTVYVYDPFQRGDIVRWQRTQYQTLTGVVATAGQSRFAVQFSGERRYLYYGQHDLVLVERRGTPDDATLLRWVQEVSNG